MTKPCQKLSRRRGRPSRPSATSRGKRLQRHFFHEKQLRSVEANTREGGRELLALAERIGMRVTVQRRPLEAADGALGDLRADRMTGAAALVIGS